MLTVQEAAQTRRSIRKYTDQAVPRADIDAILTTAGLAPSPWNLQPWRVVAVETPEVKQKLMEASYGQPQVGAAPVVFVIYTDMVNVMDKVEDTVHPGMADQLEAHAKNMRDTFGAYPEADLHWWGRGQGYTFMGYLLLAAQSLGYSTSPMLGFEADKVKALFNLPDTAQIPAIVAMGVAAEDGFPHHRHPLDRFVQYV